MIRIITVALLFTTTLGLQAQSGVEVGEQEPSSQVATPDPASREDLEKATDEMKRTVNEAVREAVRGAEEKSAEQAAKIREEADRQHKESLRLATEAEEKLRTEVTETARIQEEAQREAFEEQQAATRKMYFGLGALFLVVVTGFVVMLLKRRGGNTVYELPPTKVVPDILTDPDVPALKEFSTQNGGISKVMFRLTLSQKGTSMDGKQIVCTAELRENLSPLVYFDGEPNPVAWDKRRQAALIAAQKQSAATGSVTQ